MRICKIDNCSKVVTNWRHQCCSKSHNAKYAALVRHGAVTHERINLYPGKLYGPPIKLFYTARYKTQKAASREAINRYRSLRRSLKLIQPTWADKEEIKNFYRKAYYLTDITGIKHEVDHIIPISHPLVCGLHNEFNLQVLTKSENIAKSNKFMID